VTSQQYRTAVDERDALQERIQQQEASVQALTAERDQLAGELEDLRVASEPLARDAEKLRGIEARLPACETELADRTAKLDQLQTTYEGLVKDLEAEVASSNTKIDQLRDGLRMSLPAELLFNSGSADLSDEGIRVLADLQDLRREVHVIRSSSRPHDGVAIATACLRDQLGAQAPAPRACAPSRKRVDGTRLAAVSRGETRPVAADDCPRPRRHRHIEIG
jgi:flagellar motor protein MotB